MTPPDIEQLLEAAAAHGKESDPAHEVGDLQEMLRACWECLTVRHRNQLMVRFASLLQDWLP